MKKLFSALFMSLFAVVTLHAMDYEQAREQALFLTDKMAYELNLNDQQYEDCYEINLDYLLSVQTADDVNGNYLIYRNADLRHILFDWQYSIFATTDYFFHPLLWYRGAWSFPIYRYYTYGHFFYHRPAVYLHYRGGHGRLHFSAGFYASRRPHRWNGGFRGHDRGPIAHRGDFGRGGGRSTTRSGRTGRFGRGDNAHNNGVGHSRSGYTIGNSRTSGRDAGRSHDDAYSLGRSGSNHSVTGSTRSAGSFSRSHGDNSVGGYNHPSSTRTTVGTSVGHQSSSRSSSFSRSSSRSSSLVGSTPSVNRSSRSGSYSSSSSRSSSSFSGSSRSSSFGGSRSSGSFSGGTRSSGGSRSGGFSGGSHGGSSRGGGRGR